MRLFYLVRTPTVDKLEILLAQRDEVRRIKLEHKKAKKIFDSYNKLETQVLDVKLEQGGLFDQEKLYRSKAKFRFKDLASVLGLLVLTFIALTRVSPALYIYICILSTIIFTTTTILAKKEIR